MVWYMVLFVCLIVVDGVVGGRVPNLPALGTGCVESNVVYCVGVTFVNSSQLARTSLLLAGSLTAMLLRLSGSTVCMEWDRVAWLANKVERPAYIRNTPTATNTNHNSRLFEIVGRSIHPSILSLSLSLSLCIVNTLSILYHGITGNRSRRSFFYCLSRLRTRCWYVFFVLL
jgi:hypothetical protein